MKYLAILRIPLCHLFRQRRSNLELQPLKFKVSKRSNIRSGLSLFHIIALQSNLNLFVDDYNDGDGCREQHLNMQQLLNKQSDQHRFNTSFSGTDQIRRFEIDAIVEIGNTVSIHVIFSQLKILIE